MQIIMSLTAIAAVFVAGVTTGVTIVFVIRLKLKSK